MDAGWIVTALVAALMVGFVVIWQIRLARTRRSAPPAQHSNAYRGGGPDRAEQLYEGGHAGELYQGMSRNTQIGGGEH